MRDGRYVRGRTTPLVIGLALAAMAGTAVAQDWPGFGFDAERSSHTTAPTGIDAGHLRGLQRQQVHLDGTVDSAPIYLRKVSIRGAAHDALFVTTTYGKTIAIDARDGTILWEYTPPGYASWAGSARITTATPIADPARVAIYAASPDGEIQKLAVADGHALWRTAITRLPEREKIASALNLAGGHLIAVTGGYLGDQAPYQGHVALLDAATGKLLRVWSAECSDRTGLLDPRACPASGAAIWGRAGAVVDPDTKDLLVTTGNGPWDGKTSWGDSLIELSPNGARVIGSYTPANQAELNVRDQDLGSSSPVLLGGGLVVQGGKDGKVRMLDRARLRGAGPHPGGELQIIPTPAGARLFTAPAVMPSRAGTWLFVADNRGTAGWLLRGRRLEARWHDDRGGTSPVVSGRLLYIYDAKRGGLDVYEPATGRLLATLPAGRGHWNSPIVVDGVIALPEGDANRHETTGVLDLWRRPSS